MSLTRTTRAYNKVFVGADGRTAYEALHGKAAAQKLVEFGKKVMWFIPKKLRLKMDLRWRLDIYLGQSPTSNENFCGLPNDNVVKARAMNRVVQSGRWDSRMILATRGLPGKPTVAQQDLDFESVEANASPHANADADNQEDHQGDGGYQDAGVDEARRRAPALNRQAKITN